MISLIMKDRNGEKVDWDIIKNAVSSFTQVGMVAANIVRQDEDYVWKGSKNLEVY